MNYDWKEVKKEILENVSISNIKPKSDAGKAILRYERAINSLRRKLYIYGRSYESIFNNGEADYARECLERLNDDGGFDRKSAEFARSYQVYCEKINICFDHNLGDALA